MRPGSIPTSNRPCFRTNFLVLVLSETVLGLSETLLVLSETLLVLSETLLGLSETLLGLSETVLVLERTQTTEPIIDHERPDAYRPAIEYVATSS